MPRLLAKSAVEYRYVRDPFAIEAIEVDQLIEGLADASPGSDPAFWVGHVPPTEYDHVVLTSDRRSAACLGMLGAGDAVTEQEEEFIILKTAFVAERARGHGMMKRMIALMLLRAFGNGTLPRVIVARTSSTALYQVLRSLAAALPGAAIYPEHRSGTINLQTAALAGRVARQVGRGLRFDMSTGALRGGRLAAGGRGTSEVASYRPQDTGSPLGCLVGSPDQVVAVLDLRRSKEEEVVEHARAIYRRS